MGIVCDVLKNGGNAVLQRAAIERRRVRSRRYLSLDVARHLRTRFTSGKVVIVIDRPLIFLSNLRKQHNRVARDVQRERAATLDRAKIAALQEELAGLSALTFKTRGDINDADVVLLPPDSEQLASLSCATLYVCGDVDASSVAEPKLTVHYELAS